MGHRRSLPGAGIVTAHLLWKTSLSPSREKEITLGKTSPSQIICQYLQQCILQQPDSMLGDTQLPSAASAVSLAVGFLWNSYLKGASHRFTQCLGTEGTSKTSWFQPPAMGRTATHEIRQPGAPSTLALSSSRNKAIDQTLWLWPPNQFLIHWIVHHSNPYLTTLDIRIL